VEELVVNKQQVCCRHVLVVLSDSFFGLVRCILLQATVPTWCPLRHFVNFNTPFRLEDLPSRWPPSISMPERPGHSHLDPFLAVLHARARVFAAPHTHACICLRLSFLAAAC
jgi:hypothetical protein